MVRLKGYKECIVSKELFAISDMLRFVLSPSGDVVCDFKYNLLGEDYWVFCSRKHILQAIDMINSGKIFVGKNMKTSGNLFEKICSHQKQRCIQLLSFVKKSGKLSIGYSKVKQLLKDKKLSVLFHVQGSSDREHERLVGDNLVKSYNFLTKEDLFSLMSNCNSAHLGVERCSLSKNLCKESDRFEEMLYN